MASKTATITKQRIGRVGQRRQVVIPREIFENLNMREGDFVAFAQKDGGILVKPKRIVDADDYTPDQRRIIDLPLNGRQATESVVM